MNQDKILTKSIILVPCSDTKSSSGRMQSSLESMSFDQEFGAIRKELCRYYEDTERYYFYDEKNNKDRHYERSRSLDWTACLPAYKRYCGTMFKQVTEEAWAKNLSGVLFVSPLWGIFSPTDLIPDYTLEFKDCLINRVGDKPLKLISEIWGNTFVSIKGLYPKNKFDDLLFDEYRKIFPKTVRRNFRRPVQSSDQRGHERGRWLNETLTSREF